MLKTILSNSSDLAGEETNDNIVDTVGVDGAEVTSNNEVVGCDIKNVLIATNLAKSKKSNLTKNSNFAKDNSFETDFLTSKAEKTFIHQRKTFIKTLILYHFEPESHIWIETEALGFAIGEILCQMVSDQSFSNHMTHKNLDLISSKSKTGQ